jgi:hypothetical protein
MIKRTPALGADEAFDPLGHINPRSPTFYRDAAAAAAYLVHGEGRWLESGRCVLTTAIMHHAIRAARENRSPSLIEVHQILLEAGRQIRAAIPFIADRRVACVFVPALPAGEVAEQ